MIDYHSTPFDKEHLPDELSQTDLGNYNPEPLNLPKRKLLREPVRKSTKKYLKMLAVIYGVTALTLSLLILELWR